MAESLILVGEDADTPSFYFEESPHSFKSSRISQKSNHSDMFDSVTNIETGHALKTNDLKKSMKESQTGNFGGPIPSNNRKILQYQLKQSMEKITCFDKIIDTPPTNDYPIELSYETFNFITSK